MATRYRAPDETELANIIGTPQQRGSRALPLVEPRRRLGDHRLVRPPDRRRRPTPTRPFALPFTANSALNSTSLIASLLHYAGTNLSTNLPFGLRLSPGRETLLGTNADEEMRIENGFTSLHGGGGADTFLAPTTYLVRERFYGGSGDDTFNWSKGSHVYHGGVLNLLYVKDGIDTVSLRSDRTILRPPPAIDHIPHYNAQFVVEHTTGEDWLLSIERLEWRDNNDFIKLGPGVDLIREGLDFHLGSQSSAALTDDRGDVVDFADIQGSGLLVNAVNAQHGLCPGSRSRPERAVDRGRRMDCRNRRRTTASTCPANMRGAEGGSGNDLIDGRLAAAGSGPDR